MGPLPYAAAIKACLFLLICPTPAPADLVSNLRSTLRGLADESPVSGAAEYELYIRTRDGGDVRVEEGGIRVSWQHIDGKLELTFDEELLDQAEREQRARRIDPERSAPTRNALFSFSALQISEAIGFATILLRELEGAQVVDARRTGDQTLVTVKLPPRLGRTEKKHVRNEDIRLQLLIGADGVPVSAHRTIRIRASFFFIRIENNRTDRWTIVRRGDRLIAIRHDEEEIASGMTRAVTTRSTTVLTLDSGH